ncbi:hypothetical protein F8388_011271 [Cannabis sativa]|uniref:Uncharacterized protein n=1 Tax=Cannabis sativa TaxID=3483 RepID=A0A7J6EQN7_CANSA|nr:hypothetical protein F8388_011271 [Cannabis sativa]KAF4384489.1 hypothetical protein G4B88_007126 [Cannabis sativa]
MLEKDLYKAEYGVNISGLMVTIAYEHSIAVISFEYGYNYLRSQYAYDVAPDWLLISVEYWSVSMLPYERYIRFNDSATQ